MLQPVSPLDRIHGILLTGGGPMGLGAVAGVVRHLEARRSATTGACRTCAFRSSWAP